MKLPRLVERIRFWLWDGQYKWLDWRQDWAERKLSSRIVDGVCSVQARLIEWPGLWLICAIWGHQPTSECMDPGHDFCITCRNSMPHTFPRR